MKAQNAELYHVATHFIFLYSLLLLKQNCKPFPTILNSEISLKFRYKLLCGLGLSTTTS